MNDVSAANYLFLSHNSDCRIENRETVLEAATDHQITILYGKSIEIMILSKEMLSTVYTLVYSNIHKEVHIRRKDAIANFVECNGKVI